MELLSYDEKRKIAAQFNLIDDAFFQKVMEDVGACEELIQTILGDDSIRIVTNRPQDSLRNLLTRSVVLDLLCTDSTGRLFNVEVQKPDNDNHIKRVRYNAALIDSYSAEKGILFDELPDLYLIYIAKFDIFKRGHTVYYVDRIVRGTELVADNGVHELYLNANGRDHSKIGELMRFFLHSTSFEPNFPRIASRVEYYKENEQGVNSMCEITQRYWNEGRMEGRKEGRKEGHTEAKENIIRNMLRGGFSVETIMAMTESPEELVLQIKTTFQ